MDSHQTDNDARIYKFKVTLHELKEVLNRKVDEEGFAVMRTLPEESKGLGVWGNNRFLIGHVDEINGQSASLVDGVVLSANELGRLAAYYFEAANEIDYFYRCTGSSGGTEYRTSIYAERRLEAIYDALGQKKFEELIDSVKNEWQKIWRASDEAEARLPVCKKCGGKRVLADAANDRGRELCHACGCEAPGSVS